MTDKDKSLKAFMNKNTQSELKKPINEFSEILDKVEDKPFLIIPKWFYATAGAVAIFLFTAYFASSPDLSANDEQLIAFISTSLDDSSIYDDENDGEATLLSLVD